MSQIVIGIDLGTTNSCAAYYINGRLKILENSEGGRITPSYVYFTEKKKTIVGEYAKRMADAKPDYGVYEIKRLVGRKFDDPYVQNNLQYFSFKVIDDHNDPVVAIDLQTDKNQIETLKKTPTELCAAILTKIRNDVERKLGETVRKAVITVPAYFNMSQREVTLAAANKAGFTVLKLLNEPTAAALSYYLENNCEEVNHSLVYDLGGGTFDVAVLKRNCSKIDVIAVDGDSHLGGKDFDNLLVDYVCGELKRKYGWDPKSERRNMRRLQNQCEEAKKTLSVADETTVILTGFVRNHDVVEISITRKQFEKMADRLFKKTIDIVNNCLKSCKLSKGAVKEVILSGGSTRIPKIQDMLSAYFQNKHLNRFVNPDECVAEGAALQAAMLSTHPKQQINAIRVVDVTPLSLGLRNFVDMMTFVIPKNTPIPVCQSVFRVTVYDQQTSMTFEVYEGERLDAKMNRCLGKMSILDITPAPPGQCEVTFTMKIDANGILTVSAKEKYRNNYKDLKITYPRGNRSDKEVKNALKDAEDHKAEDERFAKFAQLKEYVLNYCIRAIYNFESMNLTRSYKEAYELCTEIKNKVDAMNMIDMNKLELLRKEVERRCDNIVQRYNFSYMPLRI